MADKEQAAAVHILGIAGTFMAGVATLAREAGISVTGSDAQVYPPMSTLLQELGIDINEGYRNTELLTDRKIIIGNALSRGNPSVEFVLNQKLPYTSGPQWLHEEVLGKRQVLAVAGTHGKTTTASILAWILHAADEQHSPGFLIGGKPGNFMRSAQLGNSPWFVVEADEYDTAFFDKRSKFVHYHPQIAILNNLEYDHADIFPNLQSIKTQFHHLLRTVPENGKLIINADDPDLADVLAMGCWTPVESFSNLQKSADWYAQETRPDCSRFEVHHGQQVATVEWPGMGQHNMRNALAAIAAACQTGIKLQQACSTLTDFKFPNKRLQRHQSTTGFTLFEDFAHHPTAIRNTLQTLREAYPGQRLIALLELRSNTMKMGIHKTALEPALMPADIACVVSSEKPGWSIENHTHPFLKQFSQTEACLEDIAASLRAEDVVVVMSNGNFDGLVNTLRSL